jgi:hypothetical protein
MVNITKLGRQLRQFAREVGWTGKVNLKVGVKLKEHGTGNRVGDQIEVIIPKYLLKDEDMALEEAKINFLHAFSHPEREESGRSFAMAHGPIKEAGTYIDPDTLKIAKKTGLEDSYRRLGEDYTSQDLAMVRSRRLGRAGGWWDEEDVRKAKEFIRRKGIEGAIEEMRGEDR